MMREYFYKLKWKRYHPQAFAMFAEVQRHEYLPLEQLMSQRETARRKIVTAAFKNTVFYRQHYSACGFELGDMEREGWFEQLPIVTKKDLREQFEEMTDQSLRAFRRVSTTGGSTGTPTKSGYDGRTAEEVYSWRLQSWFGVYPWDDHAYVWRDTRQSKFAQMKNAALWWPTRHLKLDATLLTDEKIAAFLKKFYRVKPKLLQGYVGALVQVAQYLLDHPEIKPAGNSAANQFLKVVWTTSAPLSGVQRKLLENAFGAPVCDQYGSCEIRWIAQQCAECKGLHVNVEHVNIEFADDQNLPVPNGEYGKTLLTDLENFVFPLIRYENGDRGRWLQEPCACGRTLPCIDSVKGREVEAFVLPSGKMVNGEYLTTIFDATPDIVRGFRVVQHRDLSITVEVVAPSSGVENVVRDFAEKLGGEVKVDCKVVQDIPHDRGKLRFVVREH